MSDITPEFWKLDLSRLTVAGWGLMLASCVTVLGASVLMLALLSALGWWGNEANNRPSRVFAGMVVGVGVMAGAAVFVLGQYVLSRIGLSVLRS